MTAIPETSDHLVEMVRCLRVARATAVKARTQATNARRALVVTAPAELREQLRELPAQAAGRHGGAAAPRADPDDDGGDQAGPAPVGQRYQALEAELAAVNAELDRLTAQAAPRLRQLCGVGPEIAGALLVAGDNPERLRSEVELCPHFPNQQGATPEATGKASGDQLRVRGEGCGPWRSPPAPAGRSGPWGRPPPGRGHGPQRGRAPTVLQQRHLPRADLGDRLAVDLHLEHAVEQQEQLLALLALPDQGAAGWSRRNRGLASITASDSWRSRPTRPRSRSRAGGGPAGASGCRPPRRPSA